MKGLHKCVVTGKDTLIHVSPFRLTRGKREWGEKLKDLLKEWNPRCYPVFFVPDTCISVRLSRCRGMWLNSGSPQDVGHQGSEKSEGVILKCHAAILSVLLSAGTQQGQEPRGLVLSWRRFSGLDMHSWRKCFVVVSVLLKEVTFHCFQSNVCI